MKKILIALGILLILSVSYAQEPPQPQPPSSASLESLISSIRGISMKVDTLETNLQEFKIQLNNKLEQQQRSMLLFLVIINIGYLSLLELAKRIGSWILWKRRKRETQIHHERLLNNLMVIDSSIKAFQLQIAEMQNQIKELKKTKTIGEELLEKKPQKKKSKKKLKILLFILFLIILVLIKTIWLQA